MARALKLAHLRFELCRACFLLKPERLASLGFLSLRDLALTLRASLRVCEFLLDTRGELLVRLRAESIHQRRTDRRSDSVGRADDRRRLREAIERGADAFFSGSFREIRDSIEKLDRVEEAFDLLRDASCALLKPSAELRLVLLRRAFGGRCGL